MLSKKICKQCLNEVRVAGCDDLFGWDEACEYKWHEFGGRMCPLLFATKYHVESQEEDLMHEFCPFRMEHMVVKQDGELDEIDNSVVDGEVVADKIPDYETVVEKLDFEKWFSGLKKNVKKHGNEVLIYVDYKMTRIEYNYMEKGRVNVKSLDMVDFKKADTDTSFDGKDRKIMDLLGHIGTHDSIAGKIRKILK